MNPKTHRKLFLRKFHVNIWRPADFRQPVIVENTHAHNCLEVQGSGQTILLEPKQTAKFKPETDDWQFKSIKPKSTGNSYLDSLKG